MLLRVHWTASQTMTFSGGPSKTRRLPSRVPLNLGHGASTTSPRPLRLLCVLCVRLFLFSSFLIFLPPAHAQDIEKPTLNIDDDVTAFAYAPDGRIVYSARRLFKTKKYDLQRDDIWLAEPGGRHKRLLQGEKYIPSDKPFSYMVDGLAVSPNGKYILAQLSTISVVDDAGTTQNERVTLVLDDNGREVKLGGTENIIHDSIDASWLRDSSTILYLFEAIKPNILFSFKYSSVAAGPGGFLFEGRTFLAYDMVPRANAAIAVERDRNLSGPPRLQRLDLLAQDNQELATLDDYEGGLTVSPSGKRVAYYIDKEVLEIRDLAAPDHVARIRIGLGSLRWAPDDAAILLKRAPERKSGDLVWIAVPPLATHAAGQAVPVAETTFNPILHGLAYRDFAISPDGRSLAVVPPGKRNLLVYPLSPR